MKTFKDIRDWIEMENLGGKRVLFEKFEDHRNIYSLKIYDGGTTFIIGDQKPRTQLIRVAFTGTGSVCISEIDDFGIRNPDIILQEDDEIAELMDSSIIRKEAIDALIKFVY